MPPMTGAATLVPPNTSQPERFFAVGAYTATPVLGSAIAETSATLRFEHPASVCQLGLPNTVLQPLPAPAHAVSLQPRALAAVLSEVPPTAVTCGDDAGNETPKPESPELAVIATPAWV